MDTTSAYTAPFFQEDLMNNMPVRLHGVFQQG